jgi:hypothetical protein
VLADVVVQILIFLLSISLGVDMVHVSCATGVTMIFAPITAGEFASLMSG